LLGLVFSLFTVAFNIGIPFISRYLIDGLTTGNLQALHFIGLLALYIFAALFAALLSYWMRFIPLRIGHAVETEIRDQVFRHLTTMDRSFFRTLHTGDLMNRMSTDIRTIGMAVGQGFMQIGRMVFVYVFAFLVMFSVCWQLALIMLVILPLMSFSFFFFARKVKRCHIAVQEELSEISRFSQETFAGIQTIKSFSLEDRWRSLFHSLNNVLIGRNMALARVHGAIWPLVAFWLAVGSAAILVAGGRYVILGRLSLGELVQFNQYLLYMQWPLMSLGWILTLLQRGKGSWDRILELLSSLPAIADGIMTESSLGESSGYLHFEQVSYEVDGELLLNNINLNIPAGSRVGITGPTGSGKTLLVSLVPRLIDPTQGCVLLDNHDLRCYPLDILRGQIGMAEQEPVLFSDTLARNISFGLTESNDEKVLQAADIAHLSGDVKRFPDQFETLIGERGVTLSGGQRQRTSISRAVAREPRVLILDDVLASVDTSTEAIILQKLRPVFRDRTTLFVSHRVSTLRDMDFILVIENGQITQKGSHAELTGEPGYYKRLCEIQELAAAVE